ncbi:MAG: methionyl-tRNA formyltransferase [Candidatus Paceibacterota bacterium]|jgi:methionyl-tRNA formyltransferase
MNKANFVFWGTPDVAAETLEILKQNGFLPSLIITAPDRRSGRGMQIQESPAAIFAKENNIECLKPETITVLSRVFSSEDNRLAVRSEKKLEGAEYDFFLVVAYGKIIPEDILNIPKLGSINVHYSLLPRYRGASPVESAILNGDTETGVSIQKMVYQMDAGPILAEEKVAIRDGETAPELRKRLIKVGGELLVKILPDFIENKITPKEQVGELSHCKKIKKEDGLLDLNDDGVKNYNKFRAYAHWPRTYFVKDGQRTIITKAHLEGGKFVIDRIIPEGKKEIDYRN